MYAVIDTGGKQYKVEEGQRLDVELLDADAPELSLRAVLLVDGDRVLATPAQLAGVTIGARVVGDARGPKIRGFVYKPKSNQRRRWGHRQKYSTIEITSISAGKSSSAKKSKASDAPATDARAAETAAAADGDED